MASSDNLSSIETWAFRPAFEGPWMSESFDRDTEALTKALQNSIATGHTSSPADVSTGIVYIANPEAPSSQQQGQSASSSGGGSEPETVSKRIVSRNPAPPTGKVTKRKSRASKRTPTTFITAEPENFRRLVQQVTGVRFPSSHVSVGSVFKPEPQRPGGGLNRVPVGCLLPTLDTSAFLLDHHQQVMGPEAAVVAAQGKLGFGPPGMVSEGGGPGFDFDGLSGFPTLESWKVM